MIPPIDRGAPALDPIGVVPQPTELFRTNLASAASQQGPSIMRQYADRDLYGPSGQPRPQDVAQDALGDCYFMVSVAAFARQQPQLIQNQIKYDTQSGNFQVTLYRDPEPKNPNNPHSIVTIEVTQREIWDNLKRNGGSRVDNQGYGPIWPALIETARAKMLDGNPANGLSQGYYALNHQAPKGEAGGSPRAAMETISSQPASDLSSWPLSIGEMAPDGLWRLPETMSVPTATIGFLMDVRKEYRYSEVKTALEERRPVTLATMDEDRNDGLVRNHAYQVERIGKDDSGDVEITMRNPWGDNQVGEARGNSANPVVTIKPETDGPALAQFTIGPHPADTGVG